MTKYLKVRNENRKALFLIHGWLSLRMEWWRKVGHPKGFRKQRDKEGAGGQEHTLPGHVPETSPAQSNPTLQQYIQLAINL